MSSGMQEPGHPARGRSLQDWLNALETRHPTTIELGLDRVSAVWRKMGCPRPARRIVTVAGTNGKGSTVANLTALLASLDYRVGCYTSPHLERYNERIRVNGCLVTDADLVRAFECVESARESISLTYFEFGTLAAFYLMAEQTLDFAILEIGLGGRLDAVNILDADCSVITGIGLDHQEYLGANLDSIAREKAGVMRAGRPVVCAPSEATDVLESVASDIGSEFYLAGRDFDVTACDEGFEWSFFFRPDERHNGPNLTVAFTRPALMGPHQLQNLSIALAVLALLNPDAVRCWFENPASLDKALNSVQLDGRLESPIGFPQVRIDVGHNADAAKAIMKTLDVEGLTPCLCVLAMLEGKDATRVAAALGDGVKTWYCASLAGERGRTADSLARAIRQGNRPADKPPDVLASKKTDPTGIDPIVLNEDVLTFNTVEAALEAALTDHESLSTNSVPGGILVFGSFLTASAALRMLKNRT